MGASDGKDIKTTKIVDRGPAKDCYNVVLIAEGYKADEQNQFEQDCDTFIKAFNSVSPLSDCSMGINIYRINISSTDSGADDPTACGGTGATSKTYLDATFCTGSPKIRRLIGFDTALATQLLNKEVPEWDQALIIVNSSIYGGAGGSIAIASTSGSWTYTAIHEFGHAAFALGDEYETWSGCPPPPEPAYEHHPAVEPVHPNVTIEKQRDKVKWRYLILPTTPVPTTTNPDCTKCDTQADPMPAGTVGIYEGAHYYHCGAYRPAHDCMMRNYAAFCAVCAEVIRKKLAPYAQEADIAITPWGYAQTPPKPPWWQTPDIWGTPVRNKADNDLHIRVRNAGNKISQPFTVRASFVPFTTVIDLANEILIDEIGRPALAASGIDHFIVNWDLTAAKLPAKYANFDHFCVIAQIKAKECNTTNNQAQNNFVNVPVKQGGPPPPPLRFEIANPWRQRALARLVLRSDDDLLRLEAQDFDPTGITLSPGERRVVEVALQLGGAQEFDALFEITQLLRVEGSENYQTLGGIGGVVTTHVERSEIAQLECAASRRVVVKFHDYVRLPYRDGMEEHLAHLGIGPWEALSRVFPGITLKRLFTALDEEEIQVLVSRAQELDRRYRPPNLLAYFTIECPPQVDPSALAQALLAWEAVENAYVESPPMPPPQVVNPNDDPRYKNQGHLKPAPDGVDAAYAWQFTGGAGNGIKFIDIESGWMLTHEDLSSAGVQQIYGINKSGTNFIDHGTAVLGVVIGADNAKGGIGIAPHATTQVASEWESDTKLNRPDALLKAIASLGFGDVLLLEMQASKLPVETEIGIFDLVRLATALGIVVVEAAGNGYQDLDKYKGLAGKSLLNRTSPDFKDSGAILVAAAVAAAPHHRIKSSNFGNRVDCYAWGESVDTSYCDSNGTISDYTTQFDGTSSASAIIAGVALAVQGIAAAKLKYRLSAWQMRKLLGGTTLGTPGELPPGIDVGDPGIGVMPDLKALLSKGLNLAPDVYLRDFVGDTGNPHQGAINASPDIILRTAKVADPKAAFGEGSGTENSNTLGDKAIQNQDNYLYVRLRNRGAADAKDVEVNVFFAPVATLVTPLLWTPVGSVKGLDVPGGDVLTVPDAITWKNVPKPGHYCFVGIVDSPLDPAPAISDFLDWDKFQRIVRENNNVTWRNFQVEPNVPKPPSPFCELPFLASGAPDIGRKMGLAVGMRLPEGAEAWLEAADYLVDGMGMYSPGVKPLPGQDVSRVPLNPHGRTIFGEAFMLAATVYELKLLVHIPESLRENAYQVYVSQLFQGEEVGRVTWRLVPERAR